ncbi:hypothetical protein [uncultured Dokdonia sp.]|uniref:hypothetical protein n=1 Tax=uncultured Dokdonia sp. TaxID=575653 RepID=UPI0026202F18|nr:hypothetical protein [uncultured Dokdonia sp.]
MSSKIILNEYEQHFENDVFQLQLVTTNNQKLYTVGNTIIWNFLTNNYVIKDLPMECIWIFFINGNDKIKGFVKVSLLDWKTNHPTETLRVILSADVKKVIFALHLGQIQKSLEFSNTFTIMHNNLLEKFDIEVVDTLLVNDDNYYSLIENC